MENKPKKRKKIEEKSDSENEEDEEIEKYPKKTKKPNKKTQKKTKSKSKSRSKNKEQSKEQKKTKSRSKNKSSEKEKINQPTLEKYGIKSEKKDSSSKKYPPFPNDKSKKLKIIHWNINGLRPLLKTKELDNLIKTEDPDIICFSETRIDDELIEKMDYKNLFNKTYKSYWYCAEKKGYAGTAIFTKYEPLSVTKGMNISKHDDEGRIITLEYPKFFLICCYTPNAGEGLKRIDYRVEEWDKDFFKFVKNLNKKKDIILTGDLNVAKDEIDIYQPKRHEKSAGFTKRERDSFSGFLDMGFIDTFRDLHPDEQKFSYFSRRRAQMKGDNKGWRLDYFVVNDEAKNIVVEESDMLDKDDYNSSDHIPLIFTFTCK